MENVQADTETEEDESLVASTILVTILACVALFNLILLFKMCRCVLSEFLNKNSAERTDPMRTRTRISKSNNSTVASNVTLRKRTKTLQIRNKQDEEEFPLCFDSNDDENEKFKVELHCCITNEEMNVLNEKELLNNSRHTHLKATGFCKFN